MYLSFYTGSLLNSFLIKLSKYFCNIFLSLTKRFMHLLFLSKYLAYAYLEELLHIIVMEKHYLYVRIQ